MSDTKFTPGPWRWIVNPLTKRIDLRCTRGNTVMAFERWGMQSATPLFSSNGLLEKATHFSHIATGREHHAEWFRRLDHPDAHLIAAAPDMYAVLELCLEWIGDEANCTGECVYEEDGGMCLQCIVRSTLASARGEATQ